MRRALLFLAVLFLLPSSLASEDVSGVITPTTTTTIESYPVVDSAGFRVLSAYYDPSPAEPGNYVTLWISIQNLGNKDLKNAYVRLSPGYPFSFDPGEDGVEELKLLPAWKERRFEYRLQVDEAALEGTYEIDIDLCSDSSCKSIIRSGDAEVTVKTGGKPKIEIGLEDAAIFSKETKGEFTVHLINRGKLDVQFLVVELLPAENGEYTIISPQRRYIGSLDSDDFDTEEFTIFIESRDAETQILSLPFRLEYSDENFKEYTKLEDVSITIYSAEDLKRMHLVPPRNNTTRIILGLLILSGIYYWWRKRKKAKEA